MSEQDFPPRVTLGEDGVYRWAYDMDMYGNRYLLSVLLKVFAAIGAAGYAFLLFLLGRDGRLNGRTALLALLPFLGFGALLTIGYYLAALIMHGHYRLQFAMNEESILLVRKESTQRLMDAAGALSALAGGPGAGVDASGFTQFSRVRGVREHPRYDALNLRCLTGANQIWIPPEDYDFVRDYILQRVPDRAR